MTEERGRGSVCDRGEGKEGVWMTEDRGRRECG